MQGHEAFLETAKLDEKGHVETLKGNPLQQWNTGTSMDFIYLLSRSKGRQIAKFHLSSSILSLRFMSRTSS